jgi:hypothetical protein
MIVSPGVEKDGNGVEDGLDQEIAGRVKICGVEDFVSFVRVGNNA